MQIRWKRGNKNGVGGGKGEEEREKDDVRRARENGRIN